MSLVEGGYSWQRFCNNDDDDDGSGACLVDMFQLQYFTCCPLTQLLGDSDMTRNFFIAVDAKI